MSQIILRDVILKHDIPVKTQHGITHVLIFYNDKDHRTWAWKTSTPPSNFKEHCRYSIIGSDVGNFNLSRVKEVDFDHGHEPISEQDAADAKTKLNALDILLPDMNLTNDEKYDIIIRNVDRR